MAAKDSDGVQLEVPKYSQKHPLVVNDDIKIPSLFENEQDPLGDALVGLSTSISELYKDLTIPSPLIGCIISYLSHCEDTFDVPLSSSTYISNPTTSYGTEACILISPPKETKLPSDHYIFESMTWKIAASIPSETEIFIGVQMVGPEYIQAPGEGQIVYKKKMMVPEGDPLTENQMKINLSVPLQCGKYYLLWMTSLSGSFSCRLWDGMSDAGKKKRGKLQFTDPDIMYYNFDHRHYHMYRWRPEYMNAYEVVFTAKM